MEEITSVRLQALKRRIHLNRLESNYKNTNENENKNENNNQNENENYQKRLNLRILTKKDQDQEQEIIYFRPSDFIDEFGRIIEKKASETTKTAAKTKTKTYISKHLQTSGSKGFEKLKKYLKKRFPERLVQCRALASLSEQVYTAWRSRTRKREAEWGDPEDLGVISNDPRPVEFKSAPEWPQIGIETKFILPRYFVPIPLNVGSKLYYSNRPTMCPTRPFSYFTANTAIWSAAERKTFIELYLQNPKNFGRIAAHLPYKSCEQCVEFYYRHKKEYRLKQMVASYRKAMVAQRKMILNTQISATNSSSNSNIMNLNILPMNANTNIKSLNINNVTGLNVSNSNIINNVVVDDENDNSINIPVVTPLITTTTTTITTTTTAAVSSMNSRKKTGRPVGRPKNKDRQ